MRVPSRIQGLLLLIVAQHLGLEKQAPGQCVVTECTPGALAAAIAGCPVVRLNCSGEIAMPGRIHVSRDLTLDGSGANVSLRQAGSDRLFQVATNATLTLIGLTFADTVSTNIGGVFWNEGRIIARDCVFRGNAVRGHHAGNPTPTFAGIASGGVVFQQTGGVFVATGCLFSNNAAIGGNGRNMPSGGGSSWGMTGQGGVAYLGAGVGLFTNCQFSGNSGVGGTGYDLGGSAFGGALYYGAGTTGAIVSCLFSGNTARGSGSTVAAPVWAEGGAVWSAGQIELAACSFLDNTATTTNGGPAHGGAVHSEGPLSVERSTFQRNVARAGEVGPNATYPLGGGIAIGGALCNEGTAAVANCFFELNSAKAGRGGVYQAGIPTLGGLAGGGGCGSLASNSVLWFTNSSLTRHTAQGGDGGRYGSVADAGDAWGAAVYMVGNGGLVNCTVALSTNLGGQGGSPSTGGNGGTARGAIAFYSGTNLVAFSTIASNRMAGGDGALPGRSQGAAVYAFGARVEWIGSILAGGIGSTNLTGTNMDLGFNLCSDDSIPVVAVTTHTNVNPLLGPPAHNGGLGQTMALLPGSLALDAVPAGTEGVPALDQRGVARPQGSAADIGAFELGPAGIPSVLASLAATHPVISVVGDAGHSYRLWGCTNLVEGPAWSIIATNVAQSNGPAAFVAPLLSPRQFFRAERL